MVKLTQITIGAQIGGQSLAEVVLLENEETMESFKGGLMYEASVSGQKFEFTPLSK